MKPSIQFRALTVDDVPVFMHYVGYYPTSQFGGIVAYNEAGLMGMVGFDRWTATGVEMHWFILRPRCLLPLWRESLAYLASHGKRTIVGNTPGNNVRALRMIFGRLGFIEKARIRDGYDVGIDLVISEYAIHEQELTDAGPAHADEPRAAGSRARQDGAEPATAATGSGEVGEGTAAPGWPDGTAPGRPAAGDAGHRHGDAAAAAAGHAVDPATGRPNGTAPGWPASGPYFG